MRWTRFDMPCHADDADIIAALVLMETGRGPSVSTTDSQAVVEAWVPESVCDESRAGLIARLEAADPPFTSVVSGMTETSLPDMDWQFTWRNHYRPVRVGERIVIKPSWEAWPPEGDPDEARDDDIIVEIDPGSAFGTGSHPTTQLALMVLERYVTPGDTVLDVGCGSGILSLASLRIGAAKVIGIDSDPGSIECAEKNLAPEIEA
ncbi:MAG TPA: 50S ribosomal protein L11 methyltransferase, partial [Armatimonadota bacterium]|nr:50S ribosomal protein L11 methyltransferase [Armatimonadota bacterium]